MSQNVLCITHSGDFFTIDRVMDALTQLGLTPLRLNTDRFPAQVQGSASFGNQGCHFTLNTGDRTCKHTDIGAVWMRKNWAPQIDESLDVEFREGCRVESAAAMSGFFSYLTDVPWIDPLPTITRAENKLLQLRLAHEVGFDLPATLISNDAKEVVDFYHQHNGNIVTKMLTALTVSMDAPADFVYTSKVSEEDLDALDSLKFSPMVFQELVEKEEELRAIYVDGEVFCGGIDASQSLKGKVDWRRSRPGECHWKAAEVPQPVLTAMRTLMERLGLVYGAFDLIRTPESYLFLEVNPAGEWGMIEKFLDLPISKAIARALKQRMEA